jgi:PTH1 family peptidyl-tRNA hydrolase
MSDRPADQGRDQPDAPPPPKAAAPPLRLVVGLGNPGPKYSNTRHNVGFLVVEKLAANEAEPFEHSKRWVAEVARFGQGNYLAKPQTYMNLSGEAVAKIAHFYRIDPGEILVIYDDIALPLGRLRIRQKGSAGGHNGMKSIIQHLGTEHFPRLRVGIGNTDLPGEMVDHVLGKFSNSERSELEKAVERAVLAVCHIRDHGLQDAMTLFNAAADKKKHKPAKENEESTDPNQDQNES